MNTYLIIGGLIYSHTSLFILGQVVGDSDWRRYSIKQKFIAVLGFGLLGGLVPILLVLSIIWRFFIDYIWIEIRFYYMLKFTSFWENIIKKKATEESPNKALYDANHLAERHPKDTWGGKRIRRHARALNKKFNYTYKKEE